MGLQDKLDEYKNKAGAYGPDAKTTETGYITYHFPPITRQP